jgi:glycosyltransferase involved in cell wall biosynthesis
MDFEIAIPSKGRAGLITTQATFKNATLYIPESELMQYSIYSNKIVTIPNSVKGITATRNWILKHNENRNVFFIDDDLQYFGYVERSDLKYKVKRLDDEYIVYSEIQKLFEVAEQLDSKLIGFFTVGNNLSNYAFNPFLFNGVCLGSCMGIVNDGTYYFNEEYEVKEDYELTLRNIKDGKSTVRTNILFMQHEHTQTKGGCRDSNRIEKEKTALKRLIKEYPGMIKEAKHRGTNFSIQLNL